MRNKIATTNINRDTSDANKDTSNVNRDTDNTNRDISNVSNPYLIQPYVFKPIKMFSMMMVTNTMEMMKTKCIKMP